MLLAFSILLASSLVCQTGEEQVLPTPIVAGQEITGSVSADGAREFVITAKANDCVHGMVVSLEGDVAVDVNDPSSAQLLTFDNFAYHLTEAFCFKVLEDGDYPITVFSGNDKSAKFLLYVGFRGPLGTTPVEMTQHYLQMQPPSLPGNAVALIHNGEIGLIGARGLVNSETEEPLSVATPHISHSLLAPIVASACYLLQLQDSLNVFTKANNGLDWFPSYPESITLLHLLEGTSGLPSVAGIHRIKEWDEDAQISKAEARELLEKRLLLAPSLRTPRTCDSDVFLMLEFLSVKTGLAYGDALQEVLFNPLGMTNTSLVTGDGFLPHVSASIEDVATWAAAMQVTSVWDWNVMQRLIMHDILEYSQWGDPWYFHMIPGDSFMIIETQSNEEIYDYAGAGLREMLNEPWPWFEPREKIGGIGGSLGPDKNYRAKEDSPRRGRYYSKLLDMELQIKVVDRQFTLVHSTGAEYHLGRSRWDGERWNLDGADWLWVKFDDIFDEKARRLILHCADTQVEFMRVNEE
jgi:CubicO group peptidase (beta-lactamase class C family)